MLVRTAIAIAVLLPLGLHADTATARPTRQTACGSSLLPWFASQGNGYAGGAVYVVEFSNVGKVACSVAGYPTLMLTRNGRQVGPVSQHDARVGPRPVPLAPGQTAHIVLRVTDAGVFCRPRSTNELSIQPPGSQARVYDFLGGACPGRSTLHVDAINPGVGIPYYTVR